MKKIQFAIIGAILGIPFSYYFQPEMVRSKTGSIYGYLKEFNYILEDSNLLSYLITSIIVFTVIGGGIGYYLDKNNPKPKKDSNINFANILSEIFKAILAVFILFFNKIKKSYQSNKKLFHKIGIGILSLFLVYFIFIKDYPVKDGKKLAKEACECDKDYTKKMVAMYSDFEDSFNLEKYKTRKEAYSKLYKKQQVLIDKKYSCIRKVENEYEKYKTKYKKYIKQSAFKNAYKQQEQKCYIDTKNENQLYSKIENKIQLIIDPPPSIQKITNDLVGKDLYGIQFYNNHDIKNLIIQDTEQINPNKIKYTVKIIKNSSKPTIAVFSLNYSLEKNGWELFATHPKYIKITETIANEKWTKVTPIKNWNWTSENHYNLAWKTWAYSLPTKTGPALGKVTLPYSTDYYILSEEDRPVDVIFTYKPK